MRLLYVNRYNTILKILGEVSSLADCINLITQYCYKCDIYIQNFTTYSYKINSGYIYNIDFNIDQTVFQIGFLSKEEIVEFDKRG